MPTIKLRHIYFISAVIAVALIYIRMLSSQFVLGTTTFDHPYGQFVGALIIAGVAWLCLIYGLKRYQLAHKDLFILLGVAILSRVIFIGSTPIYEDDWNRYLWDGAVTAKGVNPYDYAPEQVYEAEAADRPALLKLKAMDETHGDQTKRINYPELRTIYPPVAQALFTLAAIIKPFSLDSLRALYIATDILSFFLLYKVLQAYGRDPSWALLYALNPLLIYSGFNAAHMDILLLPPLLLCLLWVKNGQAPFRAAGALAVASAVKLWPLLLAPIIFRHWRKDYVTYVMIAATVAFLSLILNWPLIASIWAETGSESGVLAYTKTWQRSSFIFSTLHFFLEPLMDDPGRILRYCVALSVTVISLYYGFIAKDEADKLPLAMMVTTSALLFLSPTGFPWYLYWVCLLYTSDAADD